MYFDVSAMSFASLLIWEKSRQIFRRQDRHKHRQKNCQQTLLFLLLSFALSGCSVNGSGVPVPPSSARPAATQSNSAANSYSPGRPYESRTFITRAGDRRHYLFRLPAGFEQDSCADVIFDFHGAGSTAEREFRYSGFAALADREGIILVHPDANKIYIDPQHRLASYWDNAWEANLRERNYDLNFILELVDTIKAEHCAQDFFATGMSAGGDMVSALACLVDTPFKAFAPVTYRYYNDAECGAAGPRPLLSFHGDADRTVPIEGFGEPMSEVMRRWATHNSCDRQAFTQRISTNVLRYYWRNCAAETEWYLIEGDGHAWPGGGSSAGIERETEELSASELIWDFFKQ
jgi:polyhydroxybutyrate depolymerase